VQRSRGAQTLDMGVLVDCAFERLAKKKAQAEARDEARRFRAERRAELPVVGRAPSKVSESTSDGSPMSEASAPPAASSGAPPLSASIGGAGDSSDDGAAAEEPPPAHFFDSSDEEGARAPPPERPPPSPMSETPAVELQQPGSAPLPDSLMEDADEQRREAGVGAGAAADSSDEEGAHAPLPGVPTEERATETPLALPQMQLAAQAAQLAAAQQPLTPTTEGRTRRAKPRTTRATDVKPHGRRQSFVAFAERERDRVERQAVARRLKAEAAQLELKLHSTLSMAGVSIFDLLMAEYALQPDNLDSAGTMRAGFLKQLYVDEKDPMKRRGARIKGDIPAQLGVGQLELMANVFKSNALLRETAAEAISTRKMVCAEFLSGMPPFDEVRVTAEETLMAFMTRCRLLLKPAHGRRPSAAKDGPLSIRKSRGNGGQVYCPLRSAQ
jgi:hypothetical protein